jgi:hypothetical protein
VHPVQGADSSSQNLDFLSVTIDDEIDVPIVPVGNAQKYPLPFADEIDACNGDLFSS